MSAHHAASRTFHAARDLLFLHRTDYDRAYRDFRWPQFEEFNWMRDHFEVVAAGNPATALWLVEEDASAFKVSYHELAQRAAQAANFLRGLDIGRGDRLLIMLPNHPALWETLLACISLGCVAVPCSMLLSADDLEDRLARGAVRHVIAASSVAGKFGRAAVATKICVGGAVAGWVSYAESHGASMQFHDHAATRTEDPLLLYFTSGTTSKPKMVLHSHGSYPIGHLSTMYWLGLRPGDIHYNISSPGWAKHAWSCFFAPFNAGATVFIYNTERFDARRTLEVLVNCAVTSLCAPPTVWRMLVQETLTDYRVRLQSLMAAGEPLNPEIIRQVEDAWGLTIRDGYGQTETSALIGNTNGQMLKPGSMGRPLPGYEIALLDAEGVAVTEGEIAVCLAPPPAGMMLGYEGSGRPAGGAAAYHRTGDIARRDADGYFTYVGRIDDVFKSADYRISPFVIESALIEHAAVAEAAVVPSPDPVRLAVPKAFIALRRNHAPTRELAGDIFAFTRRILAPYQRVRRLEFADLPKTVSGKIRRVDLRRMEADRTPGSRNPMEFWEQDFTFEDR